MFVCLITFLRVHPFVVASFTDPARDDQQDAATEREGVMPGEIVGDSIGLSCAETKMANSETSVQSEGGRGERKW